jgi:hypothetical protein
MFTEAPHAHSAHSAQAALGKHSESHLTGPGPPLRA